MMRGQQRYDVNTILDILKKTTSPIRYNRLCYSVSYTTKVFGIYIKYLEDLNLVNVTRLEKHETWFIISDKGRKLMELFAVDGS